jgi:hypothetical protein
MKKFTDYAFDAPEHSRVNDSFEYFLPQIAHVIVLHLDLIPLEKIRPNSDFILDTEEASMSDFPDVALFLFRTTLGFGRHGEFLSDHLKKNRVYVSNRSSWHVQEERC